tara:strand:+ start:5317 stop:5682 length:366 start_codon:yes stop_codon:yes gene_type:complete
MISSKGFKNIYAIVALSFFVAMTVPTAHAEENDLAVAISDTGAQAASALATMVYFPVKTAFAMGGGIIGFGAYLLSGGDEGAAEEIWAVSNGGDFMIEPEHLSGEREIKFMGDGKSAPAAH